MLPEQSTAKTTPMSTIELELGTGIGVGVAASIVLVSSSRNMPRLVRQGEIRNADLVVQGHQRVPNILILMIPKVMPQGSAMLHGTGGPAIPRSAPSALPQEKNLFESDPVL